MANSYKSLPYKNSLKRFTKLKDNIATKSEGKKKKVIFKTTLKLSRKKTNLSISRGNPTPNKNVSRVMHHATFFIKKRETLVSF